MTRHDKEEEDDDGVLFLREACPLATLDECRRFAAAFGRAKKTASSVQHLQDFLQWKERHNLSSLLNHEDVFVNDNGDNDMEEAATTNRDAQIWQWAVQTAFAHHQKQKQQQQQQQGPPSETNDENAQEDAEIAKLVANAPVILAPKTSSNDTTNNRCNSSGSMTCRQGHRILYVLPARMNASWLALPADDSVYTTAFGLYLYRTLFVGDGSFPAAAAPEGVVATTEGVEADALADHQRQQHQQEQQRSPQKVTVLVDCRAGRGWPNVAVYKMVALIQHSCGTVLPTLFPNMVDSVQLFPIPTVACWAYRTLIAPFVNPDIRQCLHLVAGPSTHWSAPSPAAQALDAILSSDDWARLEDLRTAAFSAPE